MLNSTFQRDGRYIYPPSFTLFLFISISLYSSLSSFIFNFYFFKLFILCRLLTLQLMTRLRTWIGYKEKTRSLILIYKKPLNACAVSCHTWVHIPPPSPSLSFFFFACIFSCYTFRVTKPDYPQPDCCAETGERAAGGAVDATRRDAIVAGGTGHK